MATRIEIELTSRQDDGATFTWRASGARQPKGSADASLFPDGAAVGDEFRVETEMDVDGIRITSVLPAKGKEPKKIETLELISAPDEPLVTQQLAGKGGRGGERRGPRGDGRDGPPRRREGGRDGGRGGGGGGGGRGRGDGDGDRSGGSRPRTPAKPKLPPKPKPPRLRAGKVNRDALLDSLPDEQKAVAQEVLRGGLQSVRQGLADQNEQRKGEGLDPIDEGPIVLLAEDLLGKVRAAEWRDRAEAAIEQAETVDLRDLRSVVTASDGAAKDDETRALAARLRTALNERLDADQHAWVAEVIEMLDDDRVVRALHLSSRPPKAGAPLPAPVAMRLVEASNASMSVDVSPDRWGYIIEALAHSPVRRQVVPVSLPTKVTDELKSTIAKHGNRLPELAEIFGIEPDPRAGRAEGKRKRKSRPKGEKGEGGKPKGEKSPGETSKGEKSQGETSQGEKPQGEKPQGETSKGEAGDAPGATDDSTVVTTDSPAASAASDAPPADAPKAEAPETEEPKADAPKAEEPKTAAPETEAPSPAAPEPDAPAPDAPKIEQAPTEQAPTEQAPTQQAPTEEPTAAAPAGDDEPDA